MRMMASSVVGEVIRIVNPSSLGLIETLPMGSVRGLPHWCCDVDGQLTLVPQPGVVGVEEGWVDPISISELWLPADLPLPSSNLGVSFLLKDGQPRYIFPSLDLSLRRGQEKWRNRGRSSLPLARSWLRYDQLRQGLQLSAYAAPVPKQVEGEQVEDEVKWECLGTGVAVEPALQVLAKIISDPPPEMQAGFSFVTIVSSLGIQLPGGGRRVRVFLDPSPDPSSLLDEPEHMASQLDVVTVAVAPGGKSPYLPDCYRPLYHSAL